MVEKISEGVYHIVKEIFCVQIIVTRQLLPEENLYLHCLTDNLKDKKLIKKLVDDCQRHKGQDIYNKYMNQLTKANSNEKGESTMFEEFMERMEQMEREKKEAEVHYASRIDILNDKIEWLLSSNARLLSSNAQLSSSNEQLSSSNEQLSSSNEQMSSKIDYLEALLKQNNIQFE